MDQYDAHRRVTFAPDMKSAVVNRFGVGSGQKGYWSTDHYPTLETATAALETRLTDVREVYGTPGRDQTGRYEERDNPGAPGSFAIRTVRFVPLKKNGKPGVTIHTVTLYRIDVRPETIEAIRDALKIEVA